MAFQVGSMIFVHADAKCTLTPREGPKKGQPFTVRAASKLNAELGGSAVEAMGNSIEAVAIALGKASHTFSIGLDVSQVSVDYAVHCGNGCARMAHDIAIVLNRPGLPPVSFLIGNAIIEKGFGLSSDAGSQTKDEISGKNQTLRIKHSGGTIDPYALPGTVA